MLKNYTRQLFAQLSRHLPRRLVQRDPLPDARHLASGPIPESLGQHCLNVAAMDDQEIWRAFDSHPEGLNEGEVAAKILKHGDNQIPAQKPSRMKIKRFIRLPEIPTEAKALVPRNLPTISESAVL